MQKTEQRQRWELQARALLGQGKVILPLGLFALSLGLYIYTLAPTITWQHDGYDAGDLIVAAYTLGIPHPTGYPTYLLLGKLFTLLPIGNVAYRMNLLSAFCAAATVVLLYLSAGTLLRPYRYATVASLCAALLLATSRIFWSQALITEVYALNCLFFALLLYLVLNLQTRIAEVPANSNKGIPIFRLLIPLAWLFGLSLGNHLTIALSTPMLLLPCAGTSRRRLIGVSQWTQVLVAFLLGLSIYSYLPLSAGSQPLFNWGNPSTLRGFLWVISGGFYRQYVLGLPLAHLPARLIAWAGLLRQQFGIGGTTLGLFGAWKQARARPRQFAILLLTVLIYSAYAIGYNTTDSYVYLLPVYFLFALSIAAGAQSLLQFLTHAQRKWAQPLAVFSRAVLFLLPLSSLAVNLPLVDLSNDYTAHQYGSEVLARVPDGSLVISATDAHTFTLWYFARVVTSRAQVALIDRDLLGYDWYVNGLRQAYPWLELPAPLHIPLAIDRFLEANKENFAIFFTDIDRELMARYPSEQQGVLHRLQTYPVSAP